MATNVVKAVDLTFTIFDEKEGIAGDVELLEIACLGKSKDMCEEHPVSGEDCSSLELIEALGSIP